MPKVLRKRTASAPITPNPEFDPRVDDPSIMSLPAGFDGDAYGEAQEAAPRLARIRDLQREAMQRKLPVAIGSKEGRENLQGAQQLAGAAGINWAKEAGEGVLTGLETVVDYLDRPDRQFRNVALAAMGREPLQASLVTGRGGEFDDYRAEVAKEANPTTKALSIGAQTAGNALLAGPMAPLVTAGERLYGGRLPGAEGRDAFGLSVAQPSTAFGGGVKHAGRQLATQLGPALKALAPAKRAATIAAAQKLYSSGRRGAGTANFPKRLRKLVQDAGGDVLALEKRVGPEAEFAGKQGAKLFGVEVDRGHRVGRLVEAGAKKLAKGKSYHTRLAEEETRARKLHSRLATPRARGLLGAWDNMLSAQKEVMLFGRPGYLPVNMLEDVAKMVSRGVSPRAMPFARRALDAKRADGDVILSLDNGTSFTKKQLRDMLQDLGESRYDFSLAGPKTEKFKTAATLGFNKPIKDAASWWNRQSKMTMLVDQLMKGQSPASAKRLVRKTLYDTALAPANKTLAQADKMGRRFVPFWGYFTRSAANVPGMALSNPKMALAPTHAERGLEADVPFRDAGAEHLREMSPQVAVDMPEAGRELLDMAPGEGFNFGMRGGLLEGAALPAQLLAGHGEGALENLAFPLQMAAEIGGGHELLTGEPLPDDYLLRKAVNVGLGALPRELLDETMQRTGFEKSLIGPIPRDFDEKTDRRQKLRRTRALTGVPGDITSPMQEVYQLVESRPIRTAASENKERRRRLRKKGANRTGTR